MTASSPEYLKTARLVPLFKIANIAHPLISKVRFISILLLVSKLYERILLGRLNKVIADKDLIHEPQAGFQPGKSTLNNINRLTKLLLRAKTIA